MLIKQLYDKKFTLWFLIVAFLIIDPLLESRLTFMVRDIFDAMSRMDDLHSVLTTFFIIGAGWTLKRIFGFFQGVASAYLVKRIKVDWRSWIFKGIMKVRPSEYKNLDSGDYSSMLLNDITILEGRYLHNLIQLIADIFTIVILSAALVTLDKRLAAVILVICLIALVVPLFAQNYLRKYNFAYSVQLSRFTQRLKEYFSAFLTIRNYNSENHITSLFENENYDVEEKKYETDYALTFTSNIGTQFAFFTYFATVAYGIFLFYQGQTTIGTIIAAASFAQSIGTPVMFIVIRLNNIKSVGMIMKKLNNVVLNISSENKKTTDESVHFDNVEFDNVSININGKLIVKNFKYTFEKGKKYLIIGKNGSGKSSLVKILKQHFSDYSGIVRINGKPINNLPPNSINNGISYMGEGVSLLSYSVEDNIAMFKPYQPAEIQHVAKEVFLNVELDRILRDDGINISSGERRRIEIARSLINKAEVMIFDEVISTLDIETAYEIEKQVLCIENKIIIFVSNNFSGKLINQYDGILLLSDGMLAAHGKYHELLESNEYFRNINDIRFVKR
jgi:ABC-type multidrug transport system fused ATPase/permease subunit